MIPQQVHHNINNHINNNINYLQSIQKQKANNYILNIWQEQWDSHDKGRSHHSNISTVSFEILDIYKRKYHRKIEVGLSRIHITHCLTKSYQIIKLNKHFINSTCRFCGHFEETIQHLIQDCFGSSSITTSRNKLITFLNNNNIQINYKSLTGIVNNINEFPKQIKSNYFSLLKHFILSITQKLKL